MERIDFGKVRSAARFASIEHLTDLINNPGNRSFQVIIPNIDFADNEVSAKQREYLNCDTTTICRVITRSPRVLIFSEPHADIGMYSSSDSFSSDSADGLTLDLFVDDRLPRLHPAYGIMNPMRSRVSEDAIIRTNDVELVAGMHREVLGFMQDGLSGTESLHKLAETYAKEIRRHYPTSGAYNSRESIDRYLANNVTSLVEYPRTPDLHNSYEEIFD